MFRVSYLSIVLCVFSFSHRLNFFINTLLDPSAIFFNFYFLFYGHLIADNFTATVESLH